MLGLMDLRIDSDSGGAAEIVKVVFDEPGGVDIDGSIKRRVEEQAKQEQEPPYRCVQ